MDEQEQANKLLGIFDKADAEDRAGTLTSDQLDAYIAEAAPISEALGGGLMEPLLMLKSVMETRANRVSDMRARYGGR